MCVDVDSYSQDIPPFLEGYDRPGDDIRAVPLPVYSPKLCHYVCAEETSERCFFWTIVKPGAQEKTAMCWLKRGPGKLRTNRNTISSGNPFGEDRLPPQSSERREKDEGSSSLAKSGTPPVALKKASQ